MKRRLFLFAFSTQVSMTLSSLPRGQIKSIQDPHAYTALPIAAARAVVTKSRGAVFKDPLAEKLLVGEDHLMTEAKGFAEYMTKRAMMGDTMVQEAHSQGVRQVVSLGAGMDSRAFRMGLNDTAFFEVDSHELFESKEPLVADVPLQCESRQVVAGWLGKMDLVADLEQAGFDRHKPSVWLMEGLVMYLIRNDLQKVASEINELSAPGSSLWHDAFSKTSVDRGMSFHGVPFVGGLNDYDELWSSNGFDFAEVLDADGAWIDRSKQTMQIDRRYRWTAEQLHGRPALLFVRAWKS
jgi:methyltransferase (TIGR00027 family)